MIYLTITNRDKQKELMRKKRRSSDVWVWGVILWGAVCVDFIIKVVGIGLR